MSAISRRGQPSLLNKLDQLIQQRTKKSVEIVEQNKTSSRSHSRGSAANGRVHILDSKKISKPLPTKTGITELKWYSSNQGGELPVCKPGTIRSSIREKDRAYQSTTTREAKPIGSRGSTPSKSPVSVKPHFMKQTESSRAHKQFSKIRVPSKSPNRIQIEERDQHTELEHEKDSKWRQSLRDEPVNVTKSIDKSKGKNQATHIRVPSNSHDKKYLLPSKLGIGRTGLSSKSPIKLITSNRLNRTELQNSSERRKQNSRSIVHDEDTSTLFGKSAGDSDLIVPDHNYSSYNPGRETPIFSNNKLLKILQGHHKPMVLKPKTVTKVHLNSSNGTNNSILSSMRDSSKPQSRDTSKSKPKYPLLKEVHPVLKAVKVVERVQVVRPREVEFSEALPSKNSSKVQTLMQQASTNDKLPTPKQSLAESDFVHLETLSENGMFSGRGDSEDEKKSASRSRSRNPHQDQSRHTHQDQSRSHSRTTKEEELKKIALAGRHELSPPASSRFKRNSPNRHGPDADTGIEDHNSEHLELRKRVETLFNRDRKTPIVTAISRNQASSTKKRNLQQGETVVATLSYNTVTYH